MNNLVFLFAFLWLALPLEAQDPLSTVLKDELARNPAGYKERAGGRESG